MPNAFVSSFASAAAGISQSDRVSNGRPGGSEWLANRSGKGAADRRSRGRSNGTFRRATGTTTHKENTPVTDGARAPSNSQAYIPPHHGAGPEKHRPPGATDYRYSKEELLAIFHGLQQGPDREIRDLFVEGWQPRQASGPRGDWIKPSDRHEDGPDLCWDTAGAMQPISLVPMDDCEHELFESVNSTFKPAGQLKDKSRNPAPSPHYRGSAKFRKDGEEEPAIRQDLAPDPPLGQLRRTVVKGDEGNQQFGLGSMGAFAFRDVKTSLGARGQSRFKSLMAESPPTNEPPPQLEDDFRGGSAALGGDDVSPPPQAPSCESHGWFGPTRKRHDALNPSSAVEPGGGHLESSRSLVGLAGLGDDTWSKPHSDSPFAGFGDLNSFGGGLFHNTASSATNLAGRPSKLGSLFAGSTQPEPPRSDPARQAFALADERNSPFAAPRSGAGSPDLSQDDILPASQQRQMVMPDRMRWIYRDPQGNQQGPWSGLEMHDWYKAGFFSPELQVKKQEDGDYEPLAQLIRRIGNSREPFLVPQIGIPYGPGPAPSLTANASSTSLASAGTAQPPFASSFPSFGTTLTADQQNALERRKQEEQYLMARQKEHLATMQPVIQRHMALGQYGDLEPETPPDHLMLQQPASQEQKRFEALYDGPQRRQEFQALQELPSHRQQNAQTWQEEQWNGQQDQDLSLSQQIQKAAAEQSPWDKGLLSSSPMPAPTPQRNRQAVADNLNAESQMRSEEPAAMAPWAKEPIEAARGPSLKEIQAIEAQTAAQKEELIAATRRAVAEQERLMQQQQQAQDQGPPAPGLPSSSNWAASSASPAGAGSTPPPWAKGSPNLIKAGVVAVPKTLAQIQKEEEARKARAASAAAATSGTSGASASKRYADLAGKAGPPVTSSSPQVAWTTVGASGKTKAAAPLMRSTSGKEAASATAKPRHANTAEVKTPVPTPNAAEEFANWAKATIGRGLSAGISVDEFTSTLLSLPSDVDIISEAIYASSQTMDGRRFADEFVRRRKLADRGIVPPPSDAGNSSKAGGGWSEVAKKGGSSSDGPSTQSTNGAFRVVAGKKKGARK